ncbi:MAG: hypothetical protein ACK45H_13905 [Bacteroidota bacterium]|jgi:hypothetical protein
MKTEERTVFLAILIPIVYASIFWFETGTFIFPFPLNEVIFISVTGFFAVKHFKKYPLNSIFSAGFALLNLLSSEFFWSFLLDQPSLYELMEGGTLDLIKLMSAVLLIVWAGVNLVRGSDKVRTSLFFLFFMLYSTGLIYGIDPLMILGILVPFAASFKYRDLYPFHLLWLLLSILESMKASMLLMAF